jgi:hypothetical protein
MLFDSIKLVEGSAISNLTVATGATFPTVPDIGELFFKTDTNKLYLYTGSVWDAIGTDLVLSAVASSGSYNDLTNKPAMSGSASGTNTGDQTIVLSGDATGTGTGPITVVLATVNTAPQTDAFRKVTINAKGLVSASSAVTASDIEASLGFTPYNATNPASYIASSGAPVQSVAGKSGAVVLSQSDIGGLTTSDSPTFVTVTAALAGNASSASSAAALTTGHVISVSGDGAGSSAAFDGTAAVTVPLTLATVNSAPQTDTFRKMTVNGKGLVTATTAVVAGDITASLGFTPANKAGDTFSGAVLLAADPTQALGAATKQYVDNLAAGLVAKTAVVTSTVAALPAVTYANGTSGVGATLTASANGLLGAVGGYTPAANDRILVKNQTATLENGIYVVTNVGSAGAPFILTRAPEFDNTPTGEMIAGDFTYVQGGTLGGTQWVLTTPGTIVVGTNGITWSQLTGAGVVTAGTGITVTGNSVANAGVLSVTTGSGLSTNTSAVGNVSITNTGVTSLTGTANQVAVSGSTGAVTLSLPQSINSGAAPTFAGTNFTSIPNGALTNSAVTVGSTSIALGASSTTLAGLTSVSSTAVSAGTLSATGGLTTNAATSDTTTTSVTTTASTVVDSVSATTFRSVKYVAQVTDSTGFHVVEILVIHDGATTYKTEYAEVTSAAALGTFDAAISGGAIQLSFTATAATTKTVKVYHTALTV